MASSGFVLIVDDDRALEFERYFADAPYEVARAFDCESALERLVEWSEADGSTPCIAFVDIVLPLRKTDTETDPRGGLELMRELKRLAPEVFLVPITGKGWGSESLKRKGILDEARGIGILEYISKPVTRNEVLAVVEKAIGWRKGKSTFEDDIKRYPVDFGDGEVRFIVSVDKVMQDRVIGRIMMEGASERPVLIMGETGTGKELVARAIHGASGRKTFFSVNCAAIPEPLIESELLGYERGAFSGAAERKKGKFELADGGTLFLDEVGDLSLAAQAKLLRVLEEKEFERVGGTRTIGVDVRVVAATNQDLAKRIERGAFRADLFYRLEGIVIDIPPLRERREDISLIARYYLEALNDKHSAEKAFADETLAALSRYDWPGNVRELQNVIDHAFVSCRGSPVLAVDDLPPKVIRARGGVRRSLERLARGLLDEPLLSLDVATMLLAEEAYKQTREDHRATCEALGISVNTLNKYKRSLQEVSAALIEADFDEELAARRLPDFGSAAFLCKRVRALLFGKSETELERLADRQGYPKEWLSYMKRVVASPADPELDGPAAPSSPRTRSRS